MQLLANGKQQFIDQNGAPLASGKVYFYAPGTLTPATTYQDAAGTIPNTNPVNLDSAGQAVIWGVGSYRQIVKNTGGTTIWDQVVSTPDLNAPLVALSATSGAALVGLTQAAAGSVARTVQDKLRERVSVKDFGAKTDGTDASAAIMAAINSLPSTGGEVIFPPGSYTVTPMVMSGKNNVALRGSGKQNTQIVLSATGTALTASNCSWLSIRDMTFSAAGAAQSITNSYGVRLDAGSNNAVIDHVIFQCYAKDGLQLVGTSSATLSGNKVTNCYFLGNGGNQLYSTYNADYHFQNNQFGMVQGAAHSAVGCLLDHSDAGEYMGNYHWNNVVGFKATTSNFSRIIGNRFEESDQQGVYVDTATDMIFANNSIHTNSLGSNGTYDNAYFKTLTHCVVADNNSFDWNGGSTFHRWSLYFDTGCDGVHVKSNKASSGYGTGPIYINPANVNMNVDATLQACGSALLPAAGNNFWLGPTGQQAQEGMAHFPVGRRCMVQGVYIATFTAPGAGQTYTYTLYRNGSPTGMTATVTGTSTYTATIGPTSPPVYVADTDRLALYMATSAGSAPTYIGYTIKLSEF